MSVEEWSLEWELFAGYQTINLDQCLEEWPVVFELYCTSGKLMLKKKYYGTPLYVPITDLPRGKYRYHIYQRKEAIQKGSFEI